MQNKKGQITLFIIIGIVLIIGAAVFIYIRQTVEEGVLEQAPAGRETKYDGEQEITNFVDSCLKPIVLQG